jgi:multiple sugar transport system substrate-binding protein
MEEGMTSSKWLALVVALLAPVLASSLAHAQDVVFLSTQLRPIEEAQKVRDVLLKGAPKATYVTEEPPQLTVRMKAEQTAGKHTVSLIGALHGELQPLVSMGALEPLDDVAAKLGDRGIPASLMTLFRPAPT